jgi:hypothetical protein
MLTKPVLPQTSRTLYSTLSTSVALWRDVCRDLLMVSPNIFLQRSFERESAESLRAKVFRFVHIDRVLSTQDASSSFISKRELTITTPLVGEARVWPHIVFGTGFGFYISDLVTFHLISLFDGSELDQWTSGISGHAHDEPHMGKTIKMCASVRFGRVIITAVHTHTRYEHTLAYKLSPQNDYMT